MKKILVTASTFPRWKDDTEPKFIYDLCLEYSKYYDVTVLVPSAPGALKNEEMEGLHVKRYRYFPIKKLETLAYPGAIVPRIKEKKIRGLLVPFLFISMYFSVRKEVKKADFVHSNWLIPQGIVQPFFTKPYVLSGLGGDVTSLNKGFVKKLKKRAVDKAFAVSVVSEDLRVVLQKEYHRDDVKVIPMGVNLSMFGPEKRVENLFGSDKPIVLFVGRLAEKKGARYLIKAMQDIDATLIIVGDGPEKDFLMSESKSVQADIRFIGPKSKSELVSINASCDVFCAPSVVASDGDKDGLPVALLEAMASGAAVVGTKVGGIAEVIKDGENGYLVEPNNSSQLVEKINNILNSSGIKRKFSANARRKAEEFDFVKIGEEYKRIFDSM